MEALICAEACSTVVDASPPNGSERIDREEVFLAMCDKNASLAIAIVLDGVFAGMPPLLLVALGCGVLCAERPGLSVISRDGDLDFVLGRGIGSREDAKTQSGEKPRSSCLGVFAS